jgi:hypothetical protein
MSMNLPSRTLFQAVLFLSITVIGVLLIEPFEPAQAQLSRDEQRAQLEAELAKVEEEIKQQNNLLTQKRSERASLERDASILNAQISRAQLTIRAKNLAIGNISGEIQQKEQTIVELTERIEREKASLAQMLRNRFEIDDYSLVEIVLSNNNLSAFFSDADRYEELKIQLQATMNEIRTVTGVVEEEKVLLDKKRRAETDAKMTIESEKKTVELKEAEKKKLAAIARGEEGSYERALKERQARAAQIRSALFALRDAGAIPFGDAYSFAKEAEKTTGVRPALILAILQQESNMGQNVGTCNRPQDTLKWRDIMPGPGQSWRDDQSAYLRIMSSLGRDPEGQPLSCPIGAGWGGAMGPSQFIPATWEQYASRIARAVGVTIADPWNPRHAITATALYLSDLGAGAKTYTAERSAACKYYSGRDCGLSAMDNTFYGNAVVQRADTIQRTMIEPLEEASR